MKRRIFLKDPAIFAQAAKFSTVWQEVQGMTNEKSPPASLYSVKGECDLADRPVGRSWLHTVSRFAALGVILADANGIAR